LIDNNLKLLPSEGSFFVEKRLRFVLNKTFKGQTFKGYLTRSVLVTFATDNNQQPTSAFEY